jgi:D-alanyl-D-alanine carboxypeptidase
VSIRFVHGGVSLHAKVYVGNDAATSGSSNFTVAGLTSNLELNLGHYQPSVVTRVEEWFDRLPNAREIRVRNLMNHTSGLVRYEFDPRVAERLTREPDHVWSPVERLSYLFDTTAPFAPGQGWNYSDTNYIVLGMVIEQVTGHELYDEVRRRLLEPHRLHGIIPSDRRDLPGVVQGYAGPQNPFGGRDAMLENGRMIINPQMEWAGGGFATTAEDLAQWARLLFNGTAVPHSVLPQMLDGVAAGASSRYGLGVIIRDTPLGTGLGHSGFFPGWLTEVRYYADADIAVALQFNTSLARAIGHATSARGSHGSAARFLQRVPKSPVEVGMYRACHGTADMRDPVADRRYR